MNGVVRSIVDRRGQLDHQRFLRLQAQLARLGFALDPLSGAQLLVQRWGLMRVLKDLDEAQRFLEEVGGAA